MCRRTLFDHHDCASPPPGTRLFNASNSDDESGFPRQQFPARASQNSAPFCFPAAPQNTLNSFVDFSRLKNPPRVARPREPLFRSLGDAEEEGDQHADHEWTRRSTLHFCEDSTPRRPSAVMDENESPTPPRFSFGRGTQAVPVLAMDGDAGYSLAFPTKLWPRSPLQSSEMSNTFGRSFLPLNKEEDSRSVPLYADEVDDGISVLAAESSGSLVPARREDTCCFPFSVSLSQNTLPPERDPLAATCSFVPGERNFADMDDADVCTPRPTIVHTTASLSSQQATPCNTFGRVSTTVTSNLFLGLPHHLPSSPSPRLSAPAHAYQMNNIMCTPQTSRVELEMRNNLNIALDSTNNLFHKVAPPLVTPLTSRVFIGGYPNEETRSELHQLGVTHIINCCPSYRQPCEATRREFQWSVVDAKDDPSYFILMEHLDDFRRMMDAALGPNTPIVGEAANRTKVFIHCAGGVNRSVALAVAYLCERLDKCPVSIVKLFRDNGRPYILDNHGFRLQLIDHYLNTLRPDLLQNWS